MTTQWYIQPIDDYTNAAIANLLIADCSASDAQCDNLLVAEKRILAWRISRKNLRILEASAQKNKSLRFTIYCQHGKDAQINEWFKKQR
ncbi:MAG: hypothetical protein COX77_03790 [Candidatus Komeilibacteria bacterium CG_4_10_14_0_2_um_filter_37_10]|uniref:Uncharacterized protein n=1 Tax=Candidatus Komeilibacteria bacterium CG_4_10_14_0_2_um_filter_37_10 TaxID=1974470 RepID=A0A2M7VDU5_9BACT|nr:MAG: hypothetical protein COX77_03790 [Candidatus Komeilibacteria bacterium CG_4_10_14_0_2_um_filter_37_10]PJA92661.1 MAG: hypothetical protein CO133_01980 [Candidatus Komeilibacteria bacterium CG_4_9_14_3_um_filter_37_5]